MGERGDGGPSPIRNRLAAQAKGEWLAFLDDDDLLEPDHLLLLEAYTAEADVVYSYCTVEGRNFPLNFEFDADSLRQGNYIPVTTLVRKVKFDEVGGFGDEKLEDWGLWLRLLDAGARFVCVPIVTWTYRFRDDNRTFA